MSVTIWHMDARDGLDVNLIAERLFGRRQELELEQEQVAERADMSRAYISRLERGVIPNPKVFDLKRVAEALKMPLTDLIHVPALTPDERTALRVELTTILGPQDATTIERALIELSHRSPGERRQAINLLRALTDGPIE